MEKTMDERARRFTELEERLEEQPLPEKNAAGNPPSTARAIVRDVSWKSVEELPEWFLERKAEERNRWSNGEYADATLTAETDPDGEDEVPVTEILDDEYAVFYIDIDGTDGVVFEGKSSFSHGLTKNLRTYPDIQKVGDLFETAVPVKKNEGREYSFASFSVEDFDWLDKETVWNEFQSNTLPESSDPFSVIGYPSYVKWANEAKIVGRALGLLFGMLTVIAIATDASFTIGLSLIALVVGSLLLTQAYRIARYAFKNRS